MTVQWNDVAREAARLRGWSLEKAKAVVDRFEGTGKWGPVELLIGFRAAFKCEYCERNLLKDADSYVLWQKDHIQRHGGDDVENLALACLICNARLKNRWEPPREGNRAAQIEAVKTYLSDRRSRIERELVEVRELLT